MTVVVEDSGISKSYILSINDLDSRTKAAISDASIIILPRFEALNTEMRAFYATTPSFLKLAKQEFGSQAVALCENDGQAKLLGQHSEEIWIPILLISIDPTKDVIIPAIVNFITSFVYDRIAGRNRPTVAHLEIHFNNKKTGSQKLVRYDGPPENIRDLKAILERL